jgi:hypothetical protein
MEEIEIRITLNPVTGQLQLSGQLNNRMQAYGMLEMAKEILLKRSLDIAPQQKPGIIVPRLGLAEG